MEFSCKKGCTKCCEDNKVVIAITLEDILRISFMDKMHPVEMFDYALVADIEPGRAKWDNAGNISFEPDQVVARLNVPCPYVGEVETGVKGCTIHSYKPIVCAAAPEDRIIFESKARKKGLCRWDFCELGTIKPERIPEIVNLCSKGKQEFIKTKEILYNPPICISRDFLKTSKVFRELSSADDISEAGLRHARVCAVEAEYRQELRKRFEALDGIYNEYVKVHDFFRMN